MNALENKMNTLVGDKINLSATKKQSIGGQSPDFTVVD